MGNAGRFFCVALPFILTAASIICGLIVGLTGVTNNASLYAFEVNTTGLTLNQSTAQTLVNGLHNRNVPDYAANLIEGVKSTATSGTDAASKAATNAAASVSSSAANALGLGNGGNITASQIPGLAGVFDVNLWGYCQTSTNGTRTCTKAQFDWASKTLNTTNFTVAVNGGANQTISLPGGVSDSITAFKAIAKWAEVVYIIAMIALGLELFLGIFTYFSRIVSCVTYLVSGIATSLTIASAAMITAMSGVVIGAIDGSAKFYGVTGSINTSFLAVAWIGVAFAVGASMFWLFSACCCKRDNHSKRGGRHHDEKPFLGGNRSYAPLDGGHHGHDQGYGYNQQPHGAHRGNARSDLAYEPYSHSHSNI